MSQQKVDRYKEEKAKRRETLVKEKRKSLIIKAIASVIALVFVLWVGYSGYKTIQNNIPRKSTEIDTAALDEYMMNLTAEDEDTDESGEAADADNGDEDNGDAGDEAEPENDTESDNTDDAGEE